MESIKFCGVEIKYAKYAELKSSYSADQRIKHLIDSLPAIPKNPIKGLVLSSEDCKSIEEDFYSCGDFFCCTGLDETLPKVYQIAQETIRVDADNHEDKDILSQLRVIMLDVIAVDVE